MNANLLGHIADDPHQGATFDPGLLLKRRTDTDAECTEDERIGATEYAERNGTWKRGGDAEHITQG